MKSEASRYFGSQGSPKIARFFTKFEAMHISHLEKLGEYWLPVDSQEYKMLNEFVEDELN